MYPFQNQQSNIMYAEQRLMFTFLKHLFYRNFESQFLILSFMQAGNSWVSGANPRQKFNQKIRPGVRIRKRMSRKTTAIPWVSVMVSSPEGQQFSITKMTRKEHRVLGLEMFLNIGWFFFRAAPASQIGTYIELC